MAKVFISYSHRDGAVTALKLYEMLSHAGFDPWYDHNRVPPPSPWPDEIREQIEQCSVYIAVVTPENVQSSYWRDEVELAIAHQKSIAVILAHNLIDVPPLLCLYDHFDFTDDFYGAYQQLEAYLGWVLSPPLPDIWEAVKEKVYMSAPADSTKPEKREDDRARILPGETALALEPHLPSSVSSPLDSIYSHVEQLFEELEYQDRVHPCTQFLEYLDAQTQFIFSRSPGPEHPTPPIEWCRIPDDNLRSTQSSKSRLTLFCISKRPISKAQFMAFINAGGYSDSRWWIDLHNHEHRNTRHDWADRDMLMVKSAWLTQRLLDQMPSHQPVVNISWYEAMAYCRWLSDRLALHVQLPTDAMWEHVACTSLARITSTRDDPMYPYEQAIAGNVWEWCLTPVESPVETRYRVCRIQENAPTAEPETHLIKRAARQPEFKTADIGFRVLCTLKWLK